VNYLREIDNAIFVGGGGNLQANVNAAGAQVVLLSSTAVGEAATELADALSAKLDEPSAANDQIYLQKLQNFIERAQSELTGE
jgi:bifunctional ADP-heptose synthase (sugar kinase/adenylyltransferase)